MTSNSPGRWWRTVRRLKPAQVWGRLSFRLARPRPDLSPAPSRRVWPGPWVTPPAREASLIAPSRWRLLAQEHELAAVGWDDPTLPLLWRYHQHYFDDLNAVGAASRCAWHHALISRWLADNAPASGTGWAPYPVSLRIVNWIKWQAAGQPLTGEAVHSLAVQARWLMRRLEWHLLGNHLFVNAKALIFAGWFFEGPEARAWFTQGLRILHAQLPEQILADGGQFERSPMYHALALEDVLDLLNLLRASGPPAADTAALGAALRGRAGPMLHWLRTMSHPDGTLARFNDGTEGVAPSTTSIEAYARALGIDGGTPSAEGLTHLDASGYLRLARGDGVLWIDAAPVGPDYLPGHAHADTLSFELSIASRPLIVNRGTSVYGTGPRRQVERGTAAHSTVQVAQYNSSEVWAGFRVGRRARVLYTRIDGRQVEAAHDGYLHRPGRPLHHRRWRLDDGVLLVEDRLDPPAQEPATARWHLAPGLEAQAEGPRTWSLREGSTTVATFELIEGAVTLEPWQHAQSMGVLVPATTIAVTLNDGRAAARICWATR